MNTQDNTTPEAIKAEWTIDNESVYEMINENRGEGVRYGFAYIKFNGSPDVQEKYRALIISAPALSQEVAELRKENEHYRNALEFFLEMFKVSNDKYTEWVGTKEIYDAVIKAESALSGTKETE